MYDIQPIILAGGGGTRLWPLSREHYPKQFTRIYNEYSLLQNTLSRVKLPKGAATGYKIANPLIICNEEHRFLTIDQAKEAEIPVETILLEPVGRNTAPALTCAALQIIHNGDDAIMVMMPADHVITSIEAFQNALECACKSASEGKLITFGITPAAPETGYGYIRKGKDISHEDDATTTYQLKEFVEKPDRETAEKYLGSGEYLWNSGLFIMKASVWLEKTRQFCPEILAACQQAMKKGKSDGQFFRLDKETFENCPSDSIDYAVMEKIPATNPDDAVVVTLDAGWSDIGSWSSVHDEYQKDANNNAISGDVIAEDTTDSILISEHRLLATVGCKNMVVIETADAVLVADKRKAQDVRKIIATLNEQKREERLTHRRVFRPWGSYEGLDMGPNFQVKRLIVNPGKKLSLQMHHKRAEHWVVVSGIATVTRGEEVFKLGVNESTFIPLGMKHRLENTEDVPLEVIEVQSGTYLGEDDIVRFDDDFGRHK
ncbi:MAG TPA: mannose-1-phosphate guanylyltransferase/mannose-6-phosphate isomerase [Gammaproteobacteria bacterium]